MFPTMKKRAIIAICLLSLLLLTACSGPQSAPELPTEGDETVQTLELANFDAGCLPFLRVYRQAAEGGIWDYSYYVCTWEPDSGQLSQGELWQTEEGGMGRTLPEAWQAQCVIEPGGRFSYTKDGAVQTEALPDSEKVAGAEALCVALDGDSVVVGYYEAIQEDNLLTGVRVTAARYPLGQPENAAWVQADITEGDVSSLFTEKPVFWQGALYMAAGDRLLAMDTESGQITEPLDVAQLDALCPEGITSRQGLLIVGCCGDTLLVNRVLRVGEDGYSLTAAWRGGALLGAMEYRSADEVMQLHLFDGALQEVAVSAIGETDQLLHCFDLFPLRY